MPRSKFWDYVSGKEVERWTSEDVKAFRLLHGLRQDDLAMILGCRQQTISEWELGLRPPGKGFCLALHQAKFALGKLWQEAAATTALEYTSGTQKFITMSDKNFKQLIEEVYAGRQKKV